MCSADVRRPIEFQSYVFEPMSERGGDDPGGPSGVAAASEFGVDPDLGAGLHVPIGDGVHHGHQGEMGVDGDVTDPAVHGEYLIGRKPPFRGAFEHTITAS